jgi:DNA polymerase-3 subunit chi
MPTKIQFYHLTATPLEAAVGQLMQRALDAGFRIALWCKDTDEEKRLSNALWTFTRESFLPNGSSNEKFSDKQPILTSTSETRENQPNLLAITHGATPENIDDYSRILDIFNGLDEDAVLAARTRWKNYKQANCELQYFKQTPQGNWEQA